MKKGAKLLVLIAVFAMIVAACSSDDSDDTTTTAGEGGGGGGDELIIGVSWNNYNEERWARWDEPAIKAAIEAGGGTYISTDAGSSESQQLTDVENLISQGAKALIILAQDGTAILPAVQSALDQGIPVIAYDRLIENPGALYVTFDNIGVGRLMAEVIYEAVPTGNYVIIKGNQADANADFLREGIEEVIGEAVTAGDITIVGESYTDNWAAENAQTSMEQYLTEANNDVQAVVSENDGMATGVVAALEAQGLAGTVPVTGQDGDQTALNRIAIGTQLVSVWKDARELGTAAGNAAIEMAKGTSLNAVAGTVAFDSPGGNTMTSILLTPLPITRDNLDVVLDAGWIDEATLCANVPSGTVDVCG